jgi:hypothetical protein
MIETTSLLGAVVVHGVLLVMAYLLMVWTTGFTIQWLLRSEYHRDISRLLRGAIAMGPEGWERKDGLHGVDRNFVTKRGSIRIRRCRDRDLGSYTHEFHVGTTCVELAYLRDRMLLARTCRKWDAHFKKQEREAAQRLTLAAALNHIETHRAEYDLLDKEVVAKLCGILPPPERRTGDHT